MALQTDKGLYQLIVDEIIKRGGYSTDSDYATQASKSQVSSSIAANPSKVGDSAASDTFASIQRILKLTVPAKIYSGLVVSTYNDFQIQITEGIGCVAGDMYSTTGLTVLTVPFDVATVLFITISKGSVKIDTNESSDTLTVAKIIVPKLGVTAKIRDNKDEDNPWDAYIINLRPVTLYEDGFGNLEDTSLSFFRDNIGPILSDNLIGNIRLSEDLKITNTQGTVEIDSKSMKIYDNDENLASKFTGSGIYFYGNNEVPLAKFTTAGAEIGNMTLTENTIQSVDFVSGAGGAGFRIQDTGAAEFNNILVRGIVTSSVFQKETVSAVGGNLLILNADVLDVNMTALDNSTLTIKGDITLAVNDSLRIKDGNSDEWLTVTNVDNAPTYTVTRDRDSQYTADNNPTWQKGMAVANYGQNGDGGIIMTASATTAPYIDIYSVNSTPWNDGIDTKMRMGNLNGFLGYSTDLYGIAIGETDEYLKYDSTNGLRIKGDITITGGNASVTFYQATEPGSSGDLNVPKEGDFWIDTDDNNKLYVYESGTWTLTASTGVTTFRQNGIPTSSSAGDLWINTDTSRLYRAYIEGADEIKTGEWEEQQTNITPTESGLYLGANYMGYYNADSGYNDWTAYINCDGDVRFGSGTSYMSYCDSSETFSINSSLAGKCVEIVHGQITSNSIKLVDAACDCNYSCLEAGSWYFHDSAGNLTPYVKRIGDGFATSGTTVCLPYWCSEPKIQVGIHSLLSYNSSYATSCQQWKVSFENSCCYYESGDSWGWQFDVCAILQKSEGEYPECFVNVPFGTCCLTHDDACFTTIKSCFELWKTDDCVDHCYCYGYLCYRIWWRDTDSGCSWLCCDRTYTHPHSTIVELCTASYQTTDICMGTNKEYEFYLECINVDWCNSTLPQAVEGFICRPISNIDSGYVFDYFNIPVGYPLYHSCFTDSTDCSSSIGCSNPNNVFCAYVCYCVTGSIGIGLCETCGGTACACASVCFLLNTILVDTCCITCYMGGGPSYSCNYNCDVAHSACVDMTAYAAYNFTAGCVVANLYDEVWNGAYCFVSASCVCANTQGCLTDSYLVQCFNTYECNITCEDYTFYSMKDTSGELTVLDTTGCLNWVAIAYQ